MSATSRHMNTRSLEYRLEMRQMPEVLGLLVGGDGVVMHD